jgi:hypothetical protein
MGDQEAFAHEEAIADIVTLRLIWLIQRPGVGQMDGRVIPIALWPGGVVRFTPRSAAVPSLLL